VVTSGCIDGCIIARDVDIGMLYLMSGRRRPTVSRQGRRLMTRTFKIVSYFGAMSFALFSSSKEK
jgi:hypothetical protein